MNSLDEKYEKIILYKSNPYKEVYKAKIKGKDNYVIIKEFDKSKLNLSDEEWNKLKNDKNIIEIIDSKEYFYIIKDLCVINLEEYMKFKNEGLSIDEIKEILNQLNDILKNMNEKYLQLSNILILLNKINKISIKLSSINNSKDFLMKSPELIKEKDSSKSILWSIGIIIYYLYFKEYPYNGKDENELFNDINSDKKLKIIDNEELNDLMNKLLKKNIEERITWDEFLIHPFFKIEDEKNEILKLEEKKKVLENELIKLKEKDLSKSFLFLDPLKKLDEYHKDRVYCLTLLNDGRLVSGSDDNSIIIYNKKNYEPDIIINEHNSWINCLITLKNGILASCSHDKTIKLFYVKEKKYKEIQSLDLHIDSVNTIRELSNKYLVSGSDDKTIIFYIKNNEKYEEDYSIETSDWVRNIIQTKENEIAYSTYNENKIYFYDLNEKKNISIIDDIICCHNSLLMITKDLLLVPGINMINIINIKVHKKIKQIDIEHGGRIYGVCMLNYNTIITGGEYGILRKWIIKEDNLNLKAESEKKEGDCIFMILNMKNGHFAACYENNTIKIW